MTPLQETVRTTLRKRGDVLVGPIPRKNKPNDTVEKQVPRREWRGELIAHVDKLADDESVDVEMTFDLREGSRTARLAGVAPLVDIESDPRRIEAVRAGGFVNPYTFVPTPPRDGLDGTVFGDKPPPSHARHGDKQWSGRVVLAMTTVTPLLLPVRAAQQKKDEPTAYEVRVGPDGRPLIHGASFKGALRSAFETITASRYAAFFEHNKPLAHRKPAGAALGLTPARVLEVNGQRCFRLCRGDESWSAEGNVQDAAWVPAYKNPALVRLGDLKNSELTDHHGKQVYARVVLYRHDKGFRIWRATHLATDSCEIEKCQKSEPTEEPRPSGKLTPCAGVAPRIVRGWLSATGHSISTKHDERLFVETENLDVPLTDKHVTFWDSVLRAYDLAQDYNDPMATYGTGRNVVRSRHVLKSDELRALPAGTLVYVKYTEKDGVTEVHPVMIGRLPFDAAPAELLHLNLRPTDDRSKLSPADRLFGWVPQGREDGADRVNDGASGYRGRLVVRSITCTTDHWAPEGFPPDGVTLAPLSSPKPTQVRFYASPDPSGKPMEGAADKRTGYAAGGGLRGRKVYRWREEEPEYWEPKVDQEDRQRGYLALDGHRGKPTQVSVHRGWVRPGVTFRVELFLDGVPEPELGALLWLLTRQDEAPLRIGAGKPHGFGVVTTSVDFGATQLWDSAGVRAGWLSLARPTAVDRERLHALAAEFGRVAKGNSVLREATDSYLKAVAPVTDKVHYPRPTTEPMAESYGWFVTNEKESEKRLVNGYSLPHVRESDQRLPYFDDGPGGPGGATGRRTRNGGRR